MPRAVVFICNCYEVPVHRTAVRQIVSPAYCRFPADAAIDLPVHGVGLHCSDDNKLELITVRCQLIRKLTNSSIQLYLISILIWLVLVSNFNLSLLANVLENTSV